MTLRPFATRLMLALLSAVAVPLLGTPPAVADEGMWTYDNFPSSVVKQRYGADITPDGRYAMVANIGRGQGDNDTVSLVDLSMNPPRTVDTITVGPTPEGIKIAPNGRYAAVVVHNGSANVPTSPFYNANGKVVLVGIAGGRLAKLSEEKIGRWSQGAAFSADSATLLVQNMVEKDIMVFRIELDQLRDSMHRIKLSGGGAALGTAR